MLLPYLSGGYYLKDFAAYEVEEAKEYHQQRNNGYNNFGNSSTKNNAYIGLLGELTFGAMCKEYGIPHMHITNDPLDKFDFIVESKLPDLRKPLRIDVKTAGKQFDDIYRSGIHPKRQVYVTEKQMQKYTRPGNEIDVLVFALYCYDCERCYLLGFIELEDFVEKCVYRKAGQQVAGYPLSTSDYAIEAKELRPMFEFDKMR